jgi:hypothetical protein
MTAIFLVSGERHGHVFCGGQFYEQVRQHAMRQCGLEQQLGDATSFLVVTLVTVTMCKKRSTVTELLEFWGYARSYLPDVRRVARIDKPVQMLMRVILLWVLARMAGGAAYRTTDAAAHFPRAV